MQPREFLVLADQLAAFQAVMSGSLKKETADAKQALEDLKQANDLLLVEGKMDQDKVEFEDYRMRVQAGLDELKQDLVNQSDKVEKQEADLVAQKADLVATIAASKEAVSDKEKAVAELEKQAEAASAKQTEALNLLEKHTQTMLKREEKVLLREQEVGKKLAIIKSIG